MTFLRRYPLPACIVLGIAAACGFAPLELWWLALPAVAAWLWLVHDARSLRSALWRGWVFGVAHFTINDNWFQHAFTFQDKMPPSLGYAAPFALALYLAVYPAIAAGLAWHWRRPRIDGAWVLLSGAAWIVTEWLRSWVFTGYAWDPLAAIWVPVQPVAMLASMVGTYALSGLTVVLAGSLLLFTTRRRGIIAAAAILAAGGVAQVLSYRDTPAPAAPDAPRIVVVQPNVPQDQRGESDGQVMLARLTALSGRPGPAPRLVLWPEGVMRDLVEDDYPVWVYGMTSPWATRAWMARPLGPRDILMTGGDALRFGANGALSAATNSVFVMDAGARLRGRYDKAHLVPYGEYLPMPWLLKPLGLARLVPGDMDYLSGPGPRTLSVPGFGPIGVQVCYEIVFSGEVTDRAHRARLIFNPSNDAWFGSWGSPQFLAQARLRAIEEGLPVVRATPNGVSAVVAADGAVIATVAHHVAGAIDVPLPPARPPTLFACIGNWAAAAIAMLLVASGLVLRRRSR